MWLTSSHKMFPDFYETLLVEEKMGSHANGGNVAVSYKFMFVIQRRFAHCTELLVRWIAQQLQSVMHLE